MKKSKTKATTLRTFLSVFIIIIIGLSVIGFYYTQDWLNKLAVEIGRTVSDSTAGNSNTQAFKNLQDDIAKNQVSAKKANNIITSSQNYQSQVPQDLNKYASSTGVSIVSYNLTQSATAGVQSSVSINGVQSSFITITLGSPVQFTNLMQFLKAIESNLPKMQLTGINISSVPGSDNTVTIEPLTIEVYTQ